MVEKKKMNLNQGLIPKQAPEVRRRNFNEVALGYIEEQAIEGASCSEQVACYWKNEKPLWHSGQFLWDLTLKCQSF